MEGSFQVQTFFGQDWGVLEKGFFQNSIGNFFGVVGEGSEFFGGCASMTKRVQDEEESPLGSAFVRNEIP